MNTVQTFLNNSQDLICGPILSLVAKQAAQADATRSVDPSVIQAIKQTDLIRASATRDIGGVEANVSTIATELEALAGACASTAWCLWNHLCVFHFFCGQLGPDGTDTLKKIVMNREWVSFPAGAGTNVHGTTDGDRVVINGRASFASGARYGDWAGCLFALDHAAHPPSEKPDLRFTVGSADWK